MGPQKPTADIEDCKITFDGVDEEFDGSTERRLNLFLAANAEYRKHSELFVSEEELEEAVVIEKSLTAEKAFSYFGLMLGIFPPATIFSKFFFLQDGFRAEDIWVIILLFLVNTVAGLAGFLSGKLVGKVFTNIGSYPWWTSFLLAPFIGLGWGVLTGGFAGFFFLLIGAIFGAAIGGAVGTVSLPLFVIFYLFLKRGEHIERNQFLPVAFGITFVICGFILGYF